MSNKPQHVENADEHSVTVDPHDAKNTDQAVVANESDDAIEVTPEN